jgi:8-amino-7-oxononanoate synthase
VARLRSRIAAFREGAESSGLRAIDSPTAIQPLVTGASDLAMQASARLADLGYLVPAIRPPTVPEGTARLRISLCADHAEEDVASLVAALAESVPA